MEDYALAAEYKRIIEVLGPKDKDRPPLYLHDCAPMTLDAQAAFFFEHGFVK